LNLILDFIFIFFLPIPTFFLIFLSILSMVVFQMIP
jgi:hypothetical protein